MVTPLTADTALGRGVVRVYPGESMVSTSVEEMMLKLLPVPPATRRTYKHVKL
jgi:hypothetical protein